MICETGYDGKKFQLLDKSGMAVEFGQTVTDFRGDTGTLVSGRPPHKPSSQGHVSVDCGDYTSPSYAGVYGLQWVEVTNG